MSSRNNSGKLRMDREPISTKFTDPSHPAGKRREIDNVMKKARAGTNDYWDKKLLEVEEKDPNRWRHTGFKKMYIEGDESGSSGGESERESRYKRNNGREREEVYRRVSRSRSRSGRKSPPPTPPQVRRREPQPDHRRSPRRIQPRSPVRVSHRSPENSRKMMYRVQHSPQRRSSRSPIPRGRRSPPSPPMRRRSPEPPSAPPPSRKHGQILPRSKRPPSPPRHMHNRMPSESSGSSCTDDSCSVCSPNHHRRRSRSLSRPRRGPHSPPIVSKRAASRVKHRNEKSSRLRSSSSPAVRSAKVIERIDRDRSRDRMVRPSSNRTNRVRVDSSPPEDPRLRTRPPEPPEEPQVNAKKKKPKPSSSESKSKGKHKKLRRIKIEGEKRTKKAGTSSDSNDSDSDSEEESPISTFTATTRLTLSERFGKMAQWSMDRSNMENMRITKDSAGGALKVMIEEGLDAPSSLRSSNPLGQGGPGRRFSYSPAPAGHFPEELSTTAPSGIISWDDVRVRYEYYKSCGYLRDLNVEDYVKWEEWWYKYQDWLKQERYYEYMERQQMQRRYRKKIPISQRLN